MQTINAKISTRLWLVGWAIPFLTALVLAQPNGNRLYYAVEDLSSGMAIRRGTMGVAGIPAGSLILAADTSYRLWVFDPVTLEEGWAEFQTSGQGEEFAMPRVALLPAMSLDSDGDGLSDNAEFILGINAGSADTDGDGISDTSEIEQGLNPNDGFLIQTGVIASRDTPGNALDLAAADDLLVMADDHRGVTLYNVFNRMEPVVIGRVNTQGNALDVAIDGSVIAVANGNQGLAIIDASDPVFALVEHAVPLGGKAQAVVAAAGLITVGIDNGALSRLFQVDSETGLILASLNFNQPIHDLALVGDDLLVLTSSQLHLVGVDQGALSLIASVADPGGTNLSVGRKRMAAGGDLAYTIHRNGYNTFDISDPQNPALIHHEVLAQFGWKALALNGSGLGVAAVSPNQAFDGPHHLSLYDVSDPNVVNAFLTEFPTPGIAHGVVIYNGIAYAADYTKGLQVVNYLAFDTAGQPPTIALKASFSLDPAEVEGAKLARVTAQVGDDVQVRNVEFYVDGIKVATDGNFPFEFRFRTPRSGSQPSFSLRARVSDTGGNATWSQQYQVALTQDQTPPRVVRTTPPSGSVLLEASTVAVFFNEPMDPTTVNAASFTLRFAGNDGVLGTVDDQPVSVPITYREAQLGAFFNLPAPLGTGIYRAEISQAAKDLAGNPLDAIATWTFSVLGEGADLDGDGLADNLEAMFGLDPNLQDTDGDGIADGDEDFDGDGLTNSQEFVLGFSPALTDTNDNGVPDPQEDTDYDGLPDADELLIHLTDFGFYDTDGDGFNDGEELADLSDPLDPTQVPASLFASRIYHWFSVENLKHPQLVLGDVLAPPVSVENEEQPALSLGEIQTAPVSIDNQPTLKATAPRHGSQTPEDEDE